MSKGNANQGELKRDVGFRKKKAGKDRMEIYRNCAAGEKRMKNHVYNEMQSMCSASLHVIGIQDLFFFFCYVTSVVHRLLQVCRLDVFKDQVFIV